MAREWAVPVLLGAVVAVGLFFAFAPSPLGPEPTVRLDAVFDVAYVHADAPSHVMVVHRGQAVDNVTVQDSQGTRTVPLRWNGSRAAMVELHGPGVVLDRDQLLIDARSLVGAGVLEDGRDQIKATIYIFDEAGLLLATNAPLHERNRFNVSGDFAEIGDPWWFLGQGDAPNGSTKLPFFGPEVRARMHGLPVGGVASAWVPDHPYAWAVGPIHLTARVDAMR